MKEIFLIVEAEFRVKYYGEHFRSTVALQIEKRCCPYYHIRSQLVT